MRAEKSSFPHHLADATVALVSTLKALERD